MKLIIEDYSYKADSICQIVDGVIDTPKNKNGYVSVSYVGYCYNRRINDCVFFLPKVVLHHSSDAANGYVVLGKYNPEDLIHFDACLEKHLIKEEDYAFIYNLSVWIYRTIVEFNRLNPDNISVYSSLFSREDNTRNQKDSTLLEILLSLDRFNKENQDFFMFVVKNIHSGYNRINWTKTISRKQAYIQGNTPIYLNPVNKKKQINFDEELLVIFFSILQYANRVYGFKSKVNLNYALLTEGAFDNYLHGFGKTRLMQIKYKYFSDKALHLWNLCYSFFELADHINSSKEDADYLLVKDFYVVFEAVIDELIGDKNVLKPLKENKDGKIIDHIYPYESIINSNDIYYIGDSKYYMVGHEVQAYSEYKQYTYAKNVIQYNLDLFFKGYSGTLNYRDPITEGYNVTPNFFISAELTDDRSYTEAHLTHRPFSDKQSKHFDNRLFDRDTLWLAHYDVNFLYVIALYAASNEHAKSVFREQTRQEFREVTIKRINEKYKFYVLKVDGGNNFQEVIDRYFRLLNGKLYCPESDGSILFLALDKAVAYKEENEAVLRILGEHFICTPYDLGTNPYLALKHPKKYLADREIDFESNFMIAAESDDKIYAASANLKEHLRSLFLLGCCKSVSHKQWIFSDGNAPCRYNIREGKERKGAIPFDKNTRKPQFLLLYNFYNEADFEIYRVTNMTLKSQEEMEKLNYPNPSGSYIVFDIGEAVHFEGVDIIKILTFKRVDRFSRFIEGSPLFLYGEEIINPK